jgi:dipeptidyl-peptidase-4
LPWPTPTHRRSRHVSRPLSWVYWEEIFGRNDLAYWWSPDSSAIAYLQTDESGVSQMSYVDFEPAVPKVIHQRYPKTGTANPRVRAGVLDLESGKTTWIDLGVYPYEYLLRVNWLPDGKRLAIQTLDRPQQKLDLFLADASDTPTVSVSGAGAVAARSPCWR